MRIDMIYYPTDVVTDGIPDVDIEASGRTLAAQMTQALAAEFPGARINVWYNETEVQSEQDFEIHWSDGEIAPEERAERDKAILDRVSIIAGDVRSSRDWVVRVPGA